MSAPLEQDQLRGRPHQGLDQRPGRDIEVQQPLPRVGQQHTGTFQQHPQLGLGMGRTDMRDCPLAPSAYSALCRAVAQPPTGSTPAG